MVEFEVKNQAIAGTLESSDIQIIIESNDNNGIDIQLKSDVEKQYGRQILKKIQETLQHMGVKNAKLNVIDKGALDCTIVARTMAAVYRSAGIKKNYNWEEINSWNDLEER